MIATSLLLLAMAPASPPGSAASAPVATVAKPIGPLSRSCGTSGTKPKPSDGQYPESYGAACGLQREVKEMSKTLSDEPIDDMGARDMWNTVDGKKEKSSTTEAKDQAPKPTPQIP